MVKDVRAFELLDGSGTREATFYCLPDLNAIGDKDGKLKLVS